MVEQTLLPDNKISERNITLSQRFIVHHVSMSIIHNRNADLSFSILSLEGVIVTFTYYRYYIAQSYI